MLDDLPFAPDHVLESRWKQFLPRIAMGLALILLAMAPVALSRLLWVFDVGPAHHLWLLSGDGLASVWKLPANRAAYLPIADTLLWLQYQAFESRPQPYHVVSILLHSLNALLAWLICRRMAIPGAWLAAMIFGLHPAQLTAVAWVGGQPTLAAGALGLGAILCYLKFARITPDSGNPASFDNPAAGFFIRDGSRLNYAIACLLLAASLLAAEFASAMAPALLLLLWFRLGSSARSHLKPLAPLLLLSVAAAAFHTWHAEAGNAVSLLDRSAVAARVIGYQVSRVFYPVDRGFFAEDAGIEGAGVADILLCLVIVTAPVVLWRWRSRLGSGPFVAVAWFLVLMLPVSGVLRHSWMRHAITGDHLAYIARLGLIVCIAAAITRLADRAANPQIVRMRRAVFGAVPLSILGTLACVQAVHYADSVALWSRVLEINPRSSVAFRGLAAALVDRGQVDAAIDQLHDAAAKLPNDVDVATDLGILLARIGRSDEAEQNLRWAIHLRPDNDRAVRQLAALRLGRGNDAEALQYIESVLSRNPNDAVARGQLGSLLRHRNQPEAAIREFQRAIALQPSLVSARLELADALFQIGRLEEAAAELQQIVRIDPRNFDAYMKAGDMLGVLKDFPRAERMFRSAIRIRPKSAEAYNNLGVALAAQGRMSEAVFSFGQAIQLKPSFSAAHRNLAWATAQRDGLPKEPPASAPSPTPTALTPDRLAN